MLPDIWLSIINEKCRIFFPVGRNFTSIIEQTIYCIKYCIYLRAWSPKPKGKVARPMGLSGN